MTSNGGCSSKFSFLFSGKWLLRNTKWDLLIPRLQHVLSASDIFLMKLDTDMYLSVQWTIICKRLERVISLGCNKGEWSGEIGLSSHDEWMVCCCFYVFLDGDLGGCRVFHHFILGLYHGFRWYNKWPLYQVMHDVMTVQLVSFYIVVKALSQLWSQVKEILLGSQGDRDVNKTIECDRSCCFRNLKIRKLRWKSYLLMQRGHLFSSLG